MNESTARNLSNSFLAVRLLALHEFPASVAQGAGPYLVIQHGMDPSDSGMEPGDYLLTRGGAWMPIEQFLDQEEEDRRAQVCFPSASEVMELLDRLPGTPRVLPVEGAGREAGSGSAGASKAEVDAALLRAIRRGAES